MSAMNIDMSVFMALTPELDQKYASYTGLSAMNTDMSSYMGPTSLRPDRNVHALQCIFKHVGN